MASWTIYSKQNVAKAVVKELELHDEWMAECFITVSFKSATPVEFAVGDYVDYRDERYTLQYDPTLLKKASSGSYGEGFIYDNIKFVSAQENIANCDFNDIVLSDNLMHYTALPTFPFYCESVDDLLDRIQANLEELYPGEWIVISPDLARNRQRGACVERQQAFIDAYEQYIGSGSEFTYEKKNIAITADKNTCWDAMKWVNEQFGLNFIVRGKVIVVGTVGVVTNRKFRYGKGNGLYEIERIGDSDQKIITRLRAYGAETNIPIRYYATLNAIPYATVTEIRETGTNDNPYIWVKTDVPCTASMFTKSADYIDSQGRAYTNMGYVVDVEASGVEVVAKVEKWYDDNNLQLYCEYKTGEDPADEPDADKVRAFMNAISVGTKIYFTGGIKKKSWPEDKLERATEGLPDNMSVSRLMLPGFPTKSLAEWVEEHEDDERIAAIIEEGFTFSDDVYRPYIDSPNKDAYGIRPSNIYFDGSDSNEDIHPTIEEMTYQGVRCDVVYEAEQIDDNGVIDGEVKESETYVKITIPYAGFELDELLTDEASIDMKDGMCGGRSLKIKKAVKNDDGRWECTCVREYDDSLKIYFPYCDFQITSGDHFVLTGIELPDSYIEAAAVEMLFASVDALRANHAPRLTFQPRIDEIWMQRQHDAAIASNGVTESQHDTLKAGDIFSFADDDLGIDAKIIIDVLTIKENGNNGIPTYEVTLRDEKVVSSLERALNKISGGGASGAGMSMRQTSAMIESEGSDLFLSKRFDDEAQGVIGFLRGAWFGAKQWMIDHLGNGVLNSLTAREQVMSDRFVTSNYTGDGMFDTGGLFHYLNGKAKLVADMIVCRGKFIVNEIEDRIWTYAGGNLIFSSAGSTIFYVEYLDANGDALGYTYINSRWLLGGMRLLAGIIPWARRRQIQRSLTPEERAQVVKFRCYEVADDGTMQTRNWWHVNDLAYCQTLNRVKNKIPASGGYSGSLSNTVYVRRVAGIGSKKIPLINDDKIYDYVDLWNVYNVTGQTYVDSDGTTKTITDDVTGYDIDYSDWPTAGDVIVQRGNAVNEDRQGFSTIEVTGTQRGLKVYDNVDDYSMEGKKQAFLGYDADNKRAMLEVFGDAYIGAYGDPDPHNGSTYIRYNAQNGTLEIKAVINASSTINSKTIENYVNGLITQITDDIEAQVDKKAETYYQGTDPSSAWTTAAIKAEHVGDLWYCTANISGTNYKTGTTWRYDSNYQWKQQNIPSEVFDRIDGKAQIFIAKPNTKQTDGYCYRKNDLWILESAYTLNSVSYKAGTMVVASTDATTWSASHWTKKDMYTDDSEVNALKANTYLQALLNGDVDEAIDDLEYLQNALDEDTVIDGGLMLTSLIALRKKINGSYVTSGGIRAYDGDGTKIAAWFGGAMSDSGNNKAKIVFRHNGSGYLAGGNISWDTSGNAEFAGEVTSTSGSIGGFSIGSTWLGDSTHGYDFLKINKDGQIVMQQTDNSKLALQVNGNIQIGAYSSVNTLFVNDDEIRAVADEIHLVANDGSTNYSGFDVTTSATAVGNLTNNTTINGNTVTINPASKVVLKKPVCLEDSLITGSGSKSLPSSPSTGQTVFVKGTEGQITVSSSNGIMNQADRSVSNSYSCQEKAMMFIFDGTRWLAFYCG
jgi:hypothetical protein